MNFLTCVDKIELMKYVGAYVSSFDVHLCAQCAAAH